MVKVPDKFIESELLKLNKLKETLNVALSTLNRDEVKYESVVEILNKELESLKTNLKYLKGSDVAVVSLMDIKKIKEQIDEITVEIQATEKQIFAIGGFKRITETDLHNCEQEIKKLNKAKNKKAKIYNFPNE